MRLQMISDVVSLIQSSVHIHQYLTGGKAKNLVPLRSQEHVRVQMASTHADQPILAANTNSNGVDRNANSLFNLAVPVGENDFNLFQQTHGEIQPAEVEEADQGATGSIYLDDYNSRSTTTTQPANSFQNWVPKSNFFSGPAALWLSTITAVAIWKTFFGGNGKQPPPNNKIKVDSFENSPSSNENLIFPAKKREDVNVINGKMLDDIYEFLELFRTSYRGFYIVFYFGSLALLVALLMRLLEMLIPKSTKKKVDEICKEVGKLAKRYVEAPLDLIFLVLRSCCFCAFIVCSVLTGQIVRILVDSKSSNSLKMECVKNLHPLLFWLFCFFVLTLILSLLVMKFEEQREKTKIKTKKQKSLRSK